MVVTSLKTESGCCIKGCQHDSRWGACGLLLPCRLAYLGAELAHPSRRLLKLRGGANSILDQGGSAGYEFIAELVVCTDASAAAALRAQSKDWRHAVDCKIVEWTAELHQQWHRATGATRPDEQLDGVREHVAAAFGDRHARFFTEMLQDMQLDKYTRASKAVHLEYRRFWRDQGRLGEEQDPAPVHYRTSMDRLIDEQEARTMLEDVCKHKREAYDREPAERAMNFMLERHLAKLCKIHEARRFQIGQFNYLSFIGHFDGAGASR